jgi:glycosyltransferase involved in cell wall biosynthesis
MTAAAPTNPARPSTTIRGLRVLQFCDYYGPLNGGGSERVAREVNLRLADRGAIITVASAQSGAPFDDPGIRVMPRPAFDVTRLAGAQLVISPGYLRWATRTMQEFAPDVLYAHSIHFHGSLVAARLSRSTGVPLVGVVHVGGLESLSGRARVLAEVHERTVGRYVLSSCTEVVAVAPSVASHAARRGTHTAAIVATNGVDHERFRAGPPPTGMPDVVFVGRLVANKGPALLLDAARLLWREGMRFQVVFVGDGPLRGILDRDRAQRDEPAVFVGHSEDVRGWIRAASVVVRPSLTEGMPLAVLEAMASRRCLVVSDIPAHRELVQHEHEALLHRAGDVGDLAAQLRRVLSDERLRTELATRAHARALEFTWTRCTDGHMAALLRAARRSEQESER